MIKITKVEMKDFLRDLSKEIQKEVDLEIIGIIKSGARPQPLPLLPHPGTLGIVIEDGEYRVRGYGTEYSRFFEHISDKAIVTSGDWPWTYFDLKDGVTHDALIATFETHLIEITND